MLCDKNVIAKNVDLVQHVTSLLLVTLVELWSLCNFFCKCTIPILSYNPLNGICTYLEYMLTRTVSVT